MLLQEFAELRADVLVTDQGAARTRHRRWQGGGGPETASGASAFPLMRLSLATGPAVPVMAAKDGVDDR
jgi:hypothetical protein